jgi:hypothetical protein
MTINLTKSELGDSMSGNAVLHRTERDMIRFRLQYLMKIEKKLLKKYKDTQVEWAPRGVAIVRGKLVDGIKLLLADYESNVSRSKDAREQAYWGAQLTYFQSKLLLAKEKIQVQDLAKDISADAVDIASSSLDVATAMTDVLEKGAYIHHRIWLKISQLAEQVGTRLKVVNSGLSMALQSLGLAWDSIELIRDRVSHSDKKLSAKLLQGGRWRRMLKAGLYFSLIAMGIVLVSNPIALAIIAGIAAFMSGSMEFCHHLYERQKQIKLDKDIQAERNQKIKKLKESFSYFYGAQADIKGFFSAKIQAISRQTKKDLDISIPKELRQQVASYMVHNLLQVESKSGLSSRKIESLGTLCRTLAGILAGALLAMATAFPPLLIAGVVLSVLIVSVEAYAMRDKIKLWPAKIKQVVVLIKEKISRPIGHESEKKHIDESHLGVELVEKPGSSQMLTEGVKPVSQIERTHPEEPASAFPVGNKKVEYVLSALEKLVVTPTCSHADVVEKVRSIQDEITVVLTPKEADQVMTRYQEADTPLQRQQERQVSQQFVHSVLSDMMSSLAMKCHEKAAEKDDDDGDGKTERIK